MKALLSILMVCILMVPDGWALMKDGAKHNFKDGEGADAWFEGENSCGACHIALEKPREPMKPLWDPEYEYGIFPLYESDELRRRNGRISSSTMMCVGCHDGSIGPEYIIENNYSPTWFKRNHPVGIKYDMNLIARLSIQRMDPAPRKEIVVEPGGTPRDEDLLSGFDLPHPDLYDTNRMFARLKPPRELRLPLYKGRIECTTCHEPHQTNHNLLRGDQWPCGECHLN